MKISDLLFEMLSVSNKICKHAYVDVFAHVQEPEWFQPENMA